MAARTALRALRQVSRMGDVLPGSSSIFSPCAPRTACFPPLHAAARHFCSKKESDDLLRDCVKQAVGHGLREALSKSKPDDNSAMKLSVIREGIAAGLQETVCHYNIFFDCDDADPQLRRIVYEAVEEVLKDTGYKMPKLHTGSPESSSESSAQPTNDEEGAEDWTFTEARFSRLNRIYREFEEKNAQKKREQDACYAKVMNERAARAEEARKEERLESIKEGVVGLQEALGEVIESVEKSQQARGAALELELLNSQALVLSLGVLEDMAKDLGYLMFRDAQEAKRLESEALWVYLVLEKVSGKLPFNLAWHLKGIVRNVDMWRSFYPIVGFTVVFSRSHFTPMEWVEIARISNDDWVEKWTNKLKEYHARSKDKTGKGPQ